MHRGWVHCKESGWSWVSYAFAILEFQEATAGAKAVCVCVCGALTGKRCLSVETGMARARRCVCACAPTCQHVLQVRPDGGRGEAWETLKEALNAGPRSHGSSWS